jgi:class 3 adenylate cyclase
MAQNLCVAQIPTGTVTFLFTDIEGSTLLLKRLGDEYRLVLETHQEILRNAVAENDGREIDTQGDSFFFAFRRALDAVSAAAAAQRRLAGHEWPQGGQVRIRMGLHTGEPVAAGERYVGMGVHRAARISALGHGGQVLLSGATRGLVEDDLPQTLSLRDLGAHSLKDLERPERIYQLEIDGLRRDFPPLKSQKGLAVGGAATRPRRLRSPRTLAAVTLAGLLAGSVALWAYAGTRGTESEAREIVGAWSGVDRDGSRQEFDIRPVAGQRAYKLTLEDDDARQACGGGPLTGSGVGTLEGNELVFERFRLRCSHGGVRDIPYVLTYRESDDTILDPDETVWSRVQRAGDE